MIINVFALVGFVRGLLIAPIFSKFWFFRLIRGENFTMLLVSLLLKPVPVHHPTYMHDITLNLNLIRCCQSSHSFLSEALEMVILLIFLTKILSLNLLIMIRWSQFFVHNYKENHRIGECNWLKTMSADPVAVVEMPPQCSIWFHSFFVTEASVMSIASGFIFFP